MMQALHWRGITEKMQKVVQRTLDNADGDAMKEFPKVDSARLRELVSGRITRFVDTLTLHCMTSDYTVEMAKETAYFIHRANVLRSNVRSPYLTIALLADILRDARQLETDAVTLIAGRGEQGLFGGNDFVCEWEAGGHGDDGACCGLDFQCCD
jgi:hypothetical protein